MNWLPFGRETLVSSLPKEQLLDRLSAVTRGAHSEGSPELPPLFNGRVEANGFRISRVIEKGDNFLPLLVGKVEGTPRGSILFLRYHLFSTSRFFLWFWTGVLLAFALYFFLVTQQHFQGGICLFLLGFNYILVLVLFHRKLGHCKKLLKEVINFPASNVESASKF